MTRNRTIVAQIVLIAALSIAAFALATTRAQASEGTYRYGTPGLADATTAPTELSLLKPGRSVTYAKGPQGENCKHDGRYGWFSDVQAYRWNGTAGPRQRNEIQAHQRIRWGKVTFDGITFHNGYKHRSVLVAGWCE